MEPVIRVLILDKAVCFSLCAIALRKGINPLSVVGQAEFFFFRQPVLENESSEFKPTYTV